MERAQEYIERVQEYIDQLNSLDIAAELNVIQFSSGDQMLTLIVEQRSLVVTDLSQALNALSMILTVALKAQELLK